MTKIRVADEIKKLVWADPNRDPKEIYNELINGGVKTSESSVASYRSDFLGSVEVLKALGAFAAPAPEKAARAKKARAPSRADRWADACSRAEEALSDLRALQEEYEEWKDNLPEGLASSPVGEKLEEVCGLDIEGAIEAVGEFESVDLPRGFGRD